jgi:hypothetical protein
LDYLKILLFGFDSFFNLMKVFIFCGYCNYSNHSAPSSSSSTPASMLISPSADRPQLPSIVRPNRRLHRGGTSLFPYGRFGGQIPGTAFGHQRAPEIGNIFSGQLKSELDGKS